MIRFEESQDAVLIARLNRPVQELHARMHPRYFKPYDSGAVRKAIQQMLDEQSAKVIVAYSDDIAAGYLLYFLRDQDESAFQHPLKSLHIDQMAIEDSFLRQGIGTALLQQILVIAQKAGVHRVDLNSWTTNETALHFFRKNGFSTFNERLQLVLED